MVAADKLAQCPNVSILYVLYSKRMFLKMLKCATKYREITFYTKFFTQKMFAI